jgi:hypothetical protein
MSLLSATDDVVLIIYIIYTVFNTIFVVQARIAGMENHRACKARLAGQPTERSTSPDQLSDWERDADRTQFAIQTRPLLPARSLMIANPYEKINHRSACSDSSRKWLHRRFL